MIFQNIDGITYKLAKPFDFSFIKKYGRVFKVNAVMKSVQTES